MNHIHIIRVTSTFLHYILQVIRTALQAIPLFVSQSATLKDEKKMAQPISNSIGLPTVTTHVTLGHGSSAGNIRLISGGEFLDLHYVVESHH